MRAVTAAQMRAIDAAAVARDGEPALMRAAGEAIARLIDRYARGEGPIVALAGAGNNGGDAYAALASYAGPRRCIAYGDPDAGGSAARRDARERARIARSRGPAVSARRRDAQGCVADHRRTARGERASADPIARSTARRLDERGRHADPRARRSDRDRSDDRRRRRARRACRPRRSRWAGPSWAAFSKRPATPPASCGARRSGCVTTTRAASTIRRTDVMTPAEFAALLPRRPPESDKRSAGAPLIVAGSTQFPGAAVLCARGAARAGAGYVTVAAPEGAAAALRAHLVEQVVVTYDERDPAAAVRTILELTNRCTSIGIGPGLGLSDAFSTIVNGVIGETSLPVVADAGALYHLSKRLSAYRDKRLVLTPHAGEFARISGKGTIAPGERLARLRAFIQEHGIATLLKGRTTLVGGRDVDSPQPHRNQRTGDGRDRRRPHRRDRDVARARARADRCGAGGCILARARRAARAGRTATRRRRGRRRRSVGSRRGGRRGRCDPGANLNLRCGALGCGMREGRNLGAACEHA